MNDIIQVSSYPTAPILPLHQHDCWEFLYCTSGSATFVFDALEFTCQAGDVVVIPPETRHSHPLEEAASMILLRMDSTALALHAPMRFRDDGNQSLLHLFHDAAYQFRSESDHRVSLLRAYGQLLSQHIISQCASSPRGQLVAELSHTIMQNYANPNFELDELLKSAPYCYDYLCRLFRQELHTTPHKYLTDLRLQAAAAALRAGNSSITETAHMCGYHDPLYFSRMFKQKFGLSPREYAQQTDAAAPRP